MTWRYTTSDRKNAARRKAESTWTSKVNSFSRGQMTSSRLTSTRGSVVAHGVRLHTLDLRRRRTQRQRGVAGPVERTDRVHVSTNLSLASRCIRPLRRQLVFACRSTRRKDSGPPSEEVLPTSAYQHATDACRAARMRRMAT